MVEEFHTLAVEGKKAWLNTLTRPGPPSISSTGKPAAHFTSTSFLKQTKRSSFLHFKSIRQSAIFPTENAGRF